MYLSQLINGELVKAEITAPNFHKTYDVIVCGLGTAGSMAALMSAQNGLSVLGIESFNCVGGTTTIGGVQGHYFGCPGGRYCDVDQMVNAFQRKFTRNQLESRKIIVEEMILENGADILYESSVCGIYLEETKVVGVKIITPDGIKNVASKVLMDCTGDAYVAHMAGCRSEYGRKVDGLTQPYSMVSTVRKGENVGWTNKDFGRVDQRNDKELSKALLFSRTYEMSEERSGSAFMLHMPLIGIREGRRIVAEETVTIHDVFNGNKTKEPMFYSYADFDKHGWDWAFDGEALGDWTIGANLGAYNNTVAVPFKSIIPLGFDGIIVPCRALGVDRDVSSCVRMVVDMKKLGEAGADIALLAVKHNCPIRDIPYNELKELLTTSGCLDEAYNRGCRVDGFMDKEGNPFPKRDVVFVTDPEELKVPLSTEKPGEAIWSAKMMGEKATPTLKKLLSSNDENTRKHSALALAQIGDKTCIDELLRMAAECDDLLLKDSRKNNQFRGTMAIYFLGKLGCVDAIDTLIEIISGKKAEGRLFSLNESEQDKYFINGFNNRYFQFVSNSVSALVKIGDQFNEQRQKIAKAFIASFDDDSYYNKLTNRPKMSSEGNMVQNVKNVAFTAIKRWEI